MYAYELNSVAISSKKIDNNISIFFSYSVESAENRYLETAFKDITEHIGTLWICPRFSHSGKIDANMLGQFVNYTLKIF